MLMFLNGTAMQGQPDHGPIADARFLGAARTTPRYHFYSVRDEFPGLVPVAAGAVIVGELYEVDEAVWRDVLLPTEPSELDPGEIKLDDGRRARAMILDLRRVPDSERTDITAYGGWRQYLRSRTLTAPQARTS